MYVNEEYIANEATKTLYNENEVLSIKCLYDILLSSSPINLEREVNGLTTTLDNAVRSIMYYTVTYEVPPEERTGLTTYRCVAITKLGPYSVYIRVSYSGVCVCVCVCVCVRASLCVYLRVLI